MEYFYKESYIDPTVVKLTLSTPGFNINHLDGESLSVLFCAAYNYLTPPAVWQMLLDAGADVNLQVPKRVNNVMH